MVIDDQLIRSAISGNKEAFVALIQSYQQVLYRIAYSYVRNEHDAKEAIQELSYRSFKAIRKVDKPEAIGAWLTRMIINICHDMLRKRKREQLHDEPEQMIDRMLPQHHQSSTTDLTQSLEWFELVDQLEEAEREIIYLKYVEDYTNKHIGAELNIPEGTVKSRLHHTLRKLRARFREEGY